MIQEDKKKNKFNVSKRLKEMPNLKKTTIQTEYKEAKWGDFY